MISEAERIAGELTEAQREGLDRSFPVAENEWAWAFSTGTAEQGVRLGLARRGPSWEWPKLTPLGLEVKRILEEKE